MPMRIRISIRILVNQISISGVELQDTSGSSWRGNTQCDAFYVDLADYTASADKAYADVEPTVCRLDE